MKITFDQRGTTIQNLNSVCLKDLHSRLLKKVHEEMVNDRVKKKKRRACVDYNEVFWQLHSRLVGSITHGTDISAKITNEPTMMGRIYNRLGHEGQFVSPITRGLFEINRSYKLVNDKDYSVCGVSVTSINTNFGSINS